MIRCNDQYLLYLISLHDTSALDMLYQKYQPLILSRVGSLSIRDDAEREDFIQEGNIMFYKAVESYDPTRNKTFTRYFELILRRRFQRLREKEYLRSTLFIHLPEELIASEEDESYTIMVPRQSLSKLEDKIYVLHFSIGLKPREIAKHLSIDRKTVYNAIQRIAKKARDSLANEE